MSIPHRIYVGLGSLKLTVILILCLTLLTFVGTLAQVDKGLFDAQRLYFDAWIVMHPVRELTVPLPGGQLVMVLLFVNLLIGGFLRIRRSRRLIGVYIGHVGIALLLLAGFVKLHHSDDGYLALFEKDRANFFESHYHWELAVARPDGRELVVGETALADAIDRTLVVQSRDLPFSLRIEGFAPNSKPLPESQGRSGGDVIEGIFLQRRPRAKEREGDHPGLYLAVRGNDGVERRTMLWGSDMLQPRAWHTEIDGAAWTFDLRRVRYPLPFTVRLDDFKKEEHPGTRIASKYASDITQIGAGSDRPVEIKMNEPLRDAGYVLFQSSWGPPDARPGEPLYSQFSVVRNPSDHLPLVACIVLAIGLLWHFGSRLLRSISAALLRQQAAHS